MADRGRCRGGSYASWLNDSLAGVLLVIGGRPRWLPLRRNHGAGDWDKGRGGLGLVGATSLHQGIPAALHERGSRGFRKSVRRPGEKIIAQNSPTGSPVVASQYSAETESPTTI